MTVNKNDLHSRVGLLESAVMEAQRIIADLRCEIRALREKAPAAAGGLRLRDGGYYRTRHGKTVGPVRLRSPVFRDFDGREWHPNGGSADDDQGDSVWDIVAEAGTPAEPPPEAASTLRLREGAWYRRRDGKVVGPLEWRDTVTHVFSYRGPWGRDTYTKDGYFFHSRIPDLKDLIEEAEPPASAARPGTPRDIASSLVGCLLATNWKQLSQRGPAVEIYDLARELCAALAAEAASPSEAEVDAALEAYMSATWDKKLMRDALRDALLAARRVRL